MPKATNSAGNETLPEALQNDPQLGELIRSILAMTEFGVEAPPFSPADGSGERVVLDIECDGDRYVLIKMPHMERKALPLSPREQEIVRMVAQGYQNKIIAAVLNISSWTVCTHLRRIFAKLGVSSRAAMVARLADFGGVYEPKAILEDFGRGVYTTATVGELRSQPGALRPQFRLESLQRTVHSVGPVLSGGAAAGNPPAAGAADRASTSRGGAKPLSVKAGSRGNR
jgi:DNA-binding CsgD family transcriptional regulator